MFQIAELSVGRGVLGISPMPGRGGMYEADLTAIFQWQPNLVMSMTTLGEMTASGAGGLGDDLATADIEWAHLPVPDFGAPPDATAAIWGDVAPQAHDILTTGGRILAHCHGGCGRSGMALLRLMTEAGEPPDAALARLRVVRPCAVETDDQFRWASVGFADGG